MPEIALALSGARPSLPQIPAKEQIDEFVTRSIFGIVLEPVRATIVRLRNDPSRSKLRRVPRGYVKPDADGITRWFVL